MFHQKINLPLIIESVCFEELSLEKVFNSYNLSFDKLLILTGGDNSSFFAEQITANNRALIKHIHKNTDNSLELVSRLKNKVFDLKIDAVVGVGGGKVLDTAKYLATKTKLPYFAIPTVVSSDALASPISILGNTDKTKGYSAQIPSGILIDYEVISKSGKDHILSGLGDIFSNLSALNDWDLAVKAGKAKPNNFARFLSEVSVSNILNKEIDFSDPGFIKTYINSIIISGLAMNISGNSRPCSGSEHLLAHALTGISNSSYSHGFMVGSFTPFSLYLQNSLDHKILKILETLGFDISLAHIFKNMHDFKKAVDLAQEIRGDRFTVFNKFNLNQLEREYSNFCKDLDKS